MNEPTQEERNTGGSILLVTGTPGIGKSTVIRAVARALEDLNIGGFITDELRERGRRVGFGLSTFDGVEKILAHVGIRSGPRVSKYGVDVAALDDVTDAALEPGRDLYLVDEIGKMECFSERFIHAVTALMDSGRPVVATVALKGGGFIASVKRRPDAALWKLTPENRDGMVEKVLGWIEHKTQR